MSKYYPHEGNSTLSTSVTIHVTPDHYYLTSWAFLWSFFVLCIFFCSYQIWVENKWFAARKMTDIEQAGVGGMNNNGTGDGEADVSSADLTRKRFRRLLLVAMVTRAIMIPAQIYSEPIWAQLIADTLPVMAFASAWTLLVSFFVKLVGVALGSGTSTTPGTVIQITAYGVYVCLIVTYLFNDVAAVLLYALLCCIYAALLGTSLYFCPRLWTLLYPSLVRHSALAIRLAVCSVACLLVFAARTFGFARKVVSPPHTASWWWQYGALELAPSILFLICMHPNNASSGGGGSSTSTTGGGGRSGTNTTGGHTSGTPPLGSSSSGKSLNVHKHKNLSDSSLKGRIGSGGGGARTNVETAPLLKPISSYGSNIGDPPPPMLS